MDKSEFFLTVFLITLGCLNVAAQVYEGKCPDGWFGSKCQFQCHCHNQKTCNLTTGACGPSSKCAMGWFGLACQYQDLATLPGTSIRSTPNQTSYDWITDRNDVTCNTDRDLGVIVVSMNAMFPFTWIRLVFDYNVTQSDVTVFLLPITRALTESGCNSQKQYSITKKSVDIRCATTVQINQLIIGGQWVKYLCSLYVSGGRNVALKQRAVQTSTYCPLGKRLGHASLAIDGNRDGEYSNGSCTHTAPGDSSPSWTVTFDHPQRVHRMVLYNRKDANSSCCPDRLRYFTLQTFDAANAALFSYKSSWNTPFMVYTITAPANESQATISGVKINATFLDAAFHTTVLTLCEVEAYGECPPGTWGLECSKCESKCDSCDLDTGRCFACKGATNPPDCTNNCNRGFYGVNCSVSCSQNCNDKRCNCIDGSCDCTPGFTGRTCNEACDHKTWGEHCALTCSHFCKVDETLFPEVCHHVTGACLLGCVSGHSGATCETDNSKVIGLAAGLGCALALAVSLLILTCYLKRKQAKGVPSTSPGQTRLPINLNLGSEHASCGAASPVQTCAPLPTQRSTPGSGTQPSAGRNGTNNGTAQTRTGTTHSTTPGSGTQPSVGQNGANNGPRHGSDTQQEPIYAIPNNRSVSVEGVTQTVHHA